ncbi:hypothetical protein JR316_0002908 [Psilocybe cubensis]|uniref:Uncharacterized protein n=2 Tax=Psilocybe cubensis TaxID=181762 RepID=A0A8H7Y465_PSICU|nr:hypothetical protein JR316_0002908 [Psilocybe cubensis]KAH9483440.1 hypothetical protein JR316_0002908 [Psilocybe cubensis]
MKFLFLSSLISLAGSASAASLSCPDASRFGVPTVTPTTVKAGDSISVFVDLTCGVKNFGFIPQFLDYSIEVPANENNGFEQPIILARRTIASGTLSDSFTTTVPHAFYFANAAYNIIVGNIYNINGTDGSPVLVKGDVFIPITIEV